MAVPKKRRSKQKVSLHRALNYLSQQKFYRYRFHLNPYTGLNGANRIKNIKYFGN